MDGSWVNGTSKNSAWSECAEIGSTSRASPMGTHNESAEEGEEGNAGSANALSSSVRSPDTLGVTGSTKCLRLPTSSSSS